MNIEIIKALKKRAKEMLEDNYKRKIGDEDIYTIICELENFYTAYEKEKEEHKKECHNCDEYTARLGELETENRMLKSELEKEKEKNKEIEELKIEDEKTFIQLGECIGEKKVEDKIQAKIEELKQDEDFYREQDRMYEYEGKLNLLQSLLEKE